MIGTGARRLLTLGAVSAGLVIPLQAWGAASSPAAAPAGVGFKGAELGMTLQAWKALPFPAGGAGEVGPVCSDTPAGARAGLQLTAEERRAGLLLCTYATGLQQGLDLRHPVPIDDRFIARQVAYGFRDGRLVEIRYRTSIDAFDQVVARLSAEAGPPAEVRRDAVQARYGEPRPRVRMRWRTSGDEVELTDPVQPATEMSVRFSRIQG